MINTLLFVHLTIATLLVIIILLQKTSNDGLSGFGGGGNNLGLMSGRSTANFLTKTTITLAVIFFCNALILANLSSQLHINITNSMVSTKQDTTKAAAEGKSLPMAK